MWPTIEAAIKQVQAGVYTAQDFGTFSFMAKGGAMLAPFHEWETKLPEDVMQMVEEKEAAIMSGEFRVPVDESTPVSE
jgi:basic membrane lipoprotein Med (substrate-binding protein (PBP1-ABC) superfamily)